MLKDVSFSVRNATSYDLALSSFEFMIYLFPNSDYTLNFTLMNTAHTGDYQNITGSVVVPQKLAPTSYQFDDTTDPNSPNKLIYYEYVELNGKDQNGDPLTTKNFHTLIVKINPIEYYKKVFIENNNGNLTLDNETADKKDGVPFINNDEINVLENYYVLAPGNVYEYNVEVTVTGKGNGSGEKSIYSSIHMHATKYDKSLL